MRLFLIRHPPPAVAPGICYGATDLPLAEDPARYAAALRPLLPPAAPLFSSPLQRCRRLAEALHPAPIVDERLRELDFGDWEMQPWESLERSLLDAWAQDPLHFRPPGGEAVAALRARVADFLAELARRGGSRRARRRDQGLRGAAGRRGRLVRSFVRLRQSHVDRARRAASRLAASRRSK
jgi:alpha-ribazole phosphatase